MLEADHQTIASYLDWWKDAGLTEPAQDAPRDWLAKIAVAPAANAAPVTAQTAPTARAAAPVPLPVVPAPPGLPATLAAFDRWLADASPPPGAGWSSRRVLPSGPADAALMVLCDVPDVEDADTGTLLSGEAGALFDGILAALNLSRASIRLGSIAAFRPLGGRIDADAAPALVAIARHHIAVARPTHLIVMGQQTGALLGEASVDTGPGQRIVNHDAGIVPASFTHHPRLLLQRPALKRQVWDAIRHLKDSG